MTIKTLYRVQNADGVGYRGAKHHMWCFDILHLSDCTERFMHPDCDELLYEFVVNVLPKEQNRWKFAFENKIHLLLWFKITELERLSTHAFDIYKMIDDEHVKVGSRQVIFMVEKVLEITKIDMNDFKDKFEQNEQYIRSMYNECYSSDDEN